LFCQSVEAARCTAAVDVAAAAKPSAALIASSEKVARPGSTQARAEGPGVMRATSAPTIWSTSSATPNCRMHLSDRFALRR